jgi:hypothetical protein
MMTNRRKMATDPSYGQHNDPIEDFISIYKDYTQQYLDKTLTAMETTSAPPSYEGMSYDDLRCNYRRTNHMNAAAMTGPPMTIYDSPPTYSYTPAP